MSIFNQALNGNYRGEQANIGIQEPRAWVKIPGLDPKEPNALRYMDIEDVSKLEIRLSEAKRKINAENERIRRRRQQAIREQQQQAAQQVKFAAGTFVRYAAYGPDPKLRGKLGIVATTPYSPSDILNTSRGPITYPVNVTFEGIGIHTVSGNQLVRSSL